MELLNVDLAKFTGKETHWEETIIMPISDVQLGGIGCDEDRFRKHIEWGIKNNALFVGVGDFVDVASPSNRDTLRKGKIYDSLKLALDEAAQKHVERFLKLVKGTEGKWLGMVEGHHFHEFQDGSTSDTRIAKALGTTFLGDSAFIRLQFSDSKGSSGSITTTIWMHHGEGSGSKASSPLNKLENLIAYFDADVYLIGHMHRKVASPIDQIYMTKSNTPILGHRTRLIACTGSFLKGYMHGSESDGRPGGTYVEQRMLNPVALGGIVLKLKPEKIKKDGSSFRKVDIKVEL